MFGLIADMFEGEHESLSDAYIERLLVRDDFWAVAAFRDGQIVGGLTAHALPMTASESSVVFIYDIAVLPDHQRQGVGRHLLVSLRDAAAAVGIEELFVPADNEDSHALKFYRSLGGAASEVIHFTFAARPGRV
jgi:aminoglycoside 3-N-acetyltransferase I